MRLTERNHAVKAQAVGASEVAALLPGGHPFVTPAQLYARLTGAAPERATGSAAELGHDLEPTIVRLAARKLGAHLRRNGATVRHRTLPLCATLDAHRLDAPEAVEAKLVGAFQADAWDPLPSAVRWQVLAQMACHPRLERVHVAALIGGTRFTVVTVERDATAITEVEAAVAAFWIAHVAPRVPPEVGPDDPPELVLAFADWPADTILADGELAERGDALAAAARVRLESEHAETAARRPFIEAVAAAGAREVVAPGRWTAAVRELADGRQSLTFRPRPGGPAA
jgi:predicted phage-related endonuclease